MFPLLTPLQNGIVIGLLILWLVVYVIGMLRGNPAADRSRRLARWAKLTMIAITLVIGAIWWLGAASGTPASGVGLLLVAGLVAGAVGDLLLADLFSLARPEIAAMGVFGIGHIFYIAAVVTLWAESGTTSAGFWLSPVGGILIVSGAWLLLVRNPDGSRTLNIGSLIYGLLLGGTVSFAVALAWVVPAFWVLAAGLLLFLISDLLLAQYLIRRVVLLPYLRDVVWLVYSAGQLLIAFSIGVAIIHY